MKIAHCSVAFENMFRIPHAKCRRVNFRNEVMDRSPINLLELVRSKESFGRKNILCRHAPVLDVDGGGEILRDSLFGAADGEWLVGKLGGNEVARFDGFVERTLSLGVHVCILLVVEGKQLVGDVVVKVAVNVGIGNANRQVCDNESHQSEDISLGLIHCQGRVWVACSADYARVVCDSFHDGSGSSSEGFPLRDDSENNEISQGAKDFATIDARFRQSFCPRALEFEFPSFAEQAEGARAHVGGLFRFVRSVADYHQIPVVKALFDPPAVTVALCVVP